MTKKVLLNLLLVSLITASAIAQTNAPSIQTGVTFQWADTQITPTQPATIKTITVNNIVYLDYGIPIGYQMTQLGTTGDGANHIKLNGTNIETTSASATWNNSALAAFQDLNLNHYFEAVGNGKNICNNYTSEETTTAQRQTLTYGTGIIASSSGVIAITERSANNCYHIELFGIPVGGGAEQSLGETFVNNTSVKWGFGGTGTSGNIGTPGAVNPPPAGSDYWLSDRVVENRGTIGIALFYLDDIAPNGSLITKAQLTASTTDHGDGKLFILTLIDQDNDGLSDVDDLDDDNDGIKDTDESNGIDPSADHDTDGIPNYQDTDFCALNPNGICANLDNDNDGIPNHLDLDSDNDGIADVKEAGRGIDIDNDGKADGDIGTTATTIGIPASAGTGITPINTDGNGGFDFLDIDSDNDGIPDNVEAQTTLGYIAPSGTINPSTGIYNNYVFGLLLTDTDNDGTHDYRDIDSDNDGTPDIEENGLANTATNIDIDNDGLDNAFEPNSIFDTVWDVNEDIENPSNLSILPDADGDLNFGGDLDYRDYFNVNPPSSASIDFDGVDDYLTGESLLDGLGEITIMAWIKIDPSNAGVSNITIAGEDISCRLYVGGKGNKLLFGTRTTAGITSVVNGISINYDEWHHVTGTFSATTGTQVIYIDGKIKTKSVKANQIGQTIRNTSSWTGNFEIGRRSRNHSDMQHFNGEIDEVRVFNSALTEDQIQKLVYQEIKDNSGLVRGTTIPKDIVDIPTGTTVPWNNLIGYYPMTDIKTSTTSDFSNSGNHLTLHNITTIQEQTAPMPYETVNDGDWTARNTWLHGDVWDITSTSDNKDWSIVHVKNNVEANHAVKNLGLFIDSSKTLTINGDNQVENNWYLELNGALDLMGDSQLLQTINSDLVTSENGKILRRQEGTSNVYWYNYWSSPVGATAATALTDNNAAINNSNNSTFNIDMIKFNPGLQGRFTSSYSGSGSISTYWLYTFTNGLTYWDWRKLSISAPLNAGVGYTQKGTGAPGDTQEYTFEGKPHNGTILIDVIDKGGDGSVASVSKTEYLLGNPYASAIDIHKFIDDNEGVIDGTLQIWQQWSGASHNLADYNAGYAQVNKLGSTRARQFVGLADETIGGEAGTLLPTKYLPVGQGFVTEITATGKVQFNNSQRVFVKEADANGSGTTGSVFLKGVNAKTTNTTSETPEETTFQKIRLEFNSTTGPEAKRELLLGFSEETSDSYDYGYDAESDDTNNNDLNLDLEGKNMNMQAYSQITDDKVVPLNFKSSGDNSFEIKITEEINLDENQEIYLRDNLLGLYHNLKQDTGYTFTSTQGVFNKRFEIVFQDEAQTLSNEEVTTTENFIYFQNKENTFYAKKLNSEVTKLALVNMRGQTVLEQQNVSSTELNNGIKFNNLATGTYVVCLRTQANEVLTKKIVIN